MPAYYNENDSFAAAWLRELIKAELIAPGDVDERDIRDVAPSDLRSYIQCHFFAGIGVWSYALRCAGWPDDRPVWTGSCPCQSFSTAGKGAGFADERHLWPSWFHLIHECRPHAIFGEQVEAAIRHGWLDLVQDDLEGADYTVGALGFPAASVGAPHIRQRLYFCAHAKRDGRWTDFAQREAQGRIADGRDRATGIGSHAESRRLQQHDAEQREFRESDAGCESSKRSNADGRFASHGDLQRSGQQRLLAEDCGTGERANANRARPSSEQTERQSRSAETGNAASRSDAGDGSKSERPRLERFSEDERNGRGPGWLDADAARSIAEAGATRGFWADCDWWYGRDGKYRPTQSKLLKMADGIAGNLGRVREPRSETEEEINGKVPILRDGVNSQAISLRQAGGELPLPETKILQPTLHGAGDGGKDQESHASKQSEAVSEDRGGLLRSMRSDESRHQISRASRGLESAQQFTEELTDFVRLLPSSLALAELHGDAVTTKALRMLLTSSEAEWLVRHPPYAPEKTWASIGEESKGRIRLAVTDGDFVRVGESPLAHGASNRVGRLRGYGNALVAPQAQAFIAAVMEICNGHH